jgi:ElaB/YqjD/DUF883 family membrane-anchored ribosome-binding protein
MTDEEFKSYRFSSGEEPSDELLEELMRRAAEQARKENEEAKKRFFDDLKKQCDALRQRTQGNQNGDTGSHVHQS